MATYRCNACLGLYLSPQSGFLYFHTCPPLDFDPVTGRGRNRPNHRDENVEQTLPSPDAPPAADGKGGALGTVKMRARGAGRVKLSDEDLLTGADAARLEELRRLPGVAWADV